MAGLRTNWLGVYSGFYHSDFGGLTDQGSAAGYWSSTVNSATNAYYLDLNATRVFPAGNDTKIRGRAVRCVLG